MSITTSSNHKELTPQEIKIYVEHVKSLKQKLCGMTLILFLMILQDVC